jgi:hypothetical protein
MSTSKEALRLFFSSSQVMIIFEFYSQRLWIPKQNGGVS